MAAHHTTRAKDLVGQRFGRLLVLERAPNRPGESCAIWRCVCDCGNEKQVSTHYFKRGRAVSCGCWAREINSEKSATHRMTRSKEYYAWAAMKQRCLNPKNAMYVYYGGRGITVCERWKESFEAFLADIGPAPAGTSIDRIDNNGNYEPDNCQWTDAGTQVRNRRNCHVLHARGESHLLSDWAVIANVRKGTIANRLRAGWSDEEAIFGRNR